MWPRGTRGRVVVDDPARHAAEEFEGSHVPLEEGLRTLPWEDAHEEGVGIRQGHQGRQLTALYRGTHAAAVRTVTEDRSPVGR